MINDIKVKPCPFCGEKVIVAKDNHDKVLIERASMGLPAQVSRGEIEELICEAAPPINGWKLTERGYKSNVFKIAEDDYLKSLAELANGSSEMDEQEDNQ